MAKHLIVNVDTGEEVPVNISTYKTKHKYAFKSNWMATGFIMFDALAEAGLTKRDFKVLSGMVKHIEYGNKIRIPVKLLAEELDMQSQNISAVLRKLIDSGVIFDNRANGQGFMLNPDLAWYGSAKSHNEYMKENLKKSLQ